MFGKNQVYIMKDSNSNLTIKYTFPYSKMEAFTKYYEASKDIYTMGMCTMYGNKEDDPKRGNYAVVTLSNN